jgi:hypothetical protein
MRKFPKQTDKKYEVFLRYNRYCPSTDGFIGSGYTFKGATDNLDEAKAVLQKVVEQIRYKEDDGSYSYDDECDVGVHTEEGRVTYYILDDGNVTFDTPEWAKPIESDSNEAPF